MHPMRLETRMSGFVLVCLAVRAYGVQTVGGRWEASLLDPESAAANLPWWKSRAERVNTARQTSHTSRGLDQAHA